ncbi:MAG: hypothetical protein ACKO2G_13495 [Verrucomicrobiales bacterium]
MIELAVGIAVMLSFIWVLFIGMTAWKSGADRSNCIVNIRNVHVASRSYENLHGIREGQDFQPSFIIGTDSFVQQMPECPAGGTHTFASKFPASGSLIMNCSVQSHVPATKTGW